MTIPDEMLEIVTDRIQVLLKDEEIQSQLIALHDDGLSNEYVRNHLVNIAIATLLGL